MEFLNILIDFLNSRFSLILYLIAAIIGMFLHAFWCELKHKNDDDFMDFD